MGGSMRELRPAVGVALLMSIGLVVTSGSVARSTREATMVMVGFSLGLVAAWLVDLSHHFLARRAVARGSMHAQDGCPQDRHEYPGPQ